MLKFLKYSIKKSLKIKKNNKNLKNLNKKLKKN